MDYELYLRSKEPSGDGARALRASLSEDPDLLGDGPRFPVEIPDGRLELRLHPERADWWAAPDDATRYGLDLRIPGGANPRLAAAGCERAFAWAKQGDLTVYDPQLGREVRARDQETIVQRVGRLADYLTDTVGLGGDGGAQIEVDTPRPALPFRTKFYLALAGTLALLALLTQLC